MVKTVPFTKMQGIGNDYVYVNGFDVNVENPGELAKKISDRHFGAGSDGLVLILPSDKADLRMRMFNADGTEAEMCGNATRCVGKYAWDNGLIKKNPITLETGAGIKVIDLVLENGIAVGATVDMGEPVLEPELIPARAPEGMNRIVAAPINVDGSQYEFTAVSMGNPHAIILMEGIDGLKLPEIGPKFEHHEFFPRRINTEFVEIISRNRIRMRVWERGAGETLACGTGACAVLVACALNGMTDREADVELLGGTLHIRWDTSNDHVYMTGPAKTVFTGEYFLD